MEIRTLPKCRRVPGTEIVKREMAARNWTRSDGRARLRRLAASREMTVRYLVAANRFTPQSVLDRLAADDDAMVGWAARRTEGGPPDYERIPMMAIRRIICDYVMTDDSVEAFYRLSLLGLVEVGASGQVWWRGRLVQDRYSPYCRLSWVPGELARVAPRLHYVCVTFWWRCFRVRVEVHRLVYRMFKGRTPRGYRVHHVDRNRQNNCPANLQLMSARDHILLHVPDVRRGWYARKVEKELPAAECAV